MARKYLLLLALLAIAGCTQPKESAGQYYFNLSDIHHFILTNSMNDVLNYNGDVMVDYSGPKSSAIYNAHKSNVSYSTFLSIIAIENNNDVLPKTRALSINGTPLLEHNIDGWYVHSLAYKSWLNYLKEKIRESIDKGVDIIMLDDDYFMAQLPMSSQDGMAGDFSNKSMEGFAQYLMEKNIISNSSFDYRLYLKNLGYNDSKIAEILRKSFSYEKDENIPYWNYFKDYMLRTNIAALKELIEYGHSYAKSVNKTVYFAAYPDLYWYPFFDSDVGFDLLTGEIMYAYDSGVAPRGRSVQYVKLGNSQLGRAKCVKYPDADRDIELTRNANVLAARYAETYSNGGCIFINPMPMTTEEMGNPLAFLSADKLNHTLISNIMNFVRGHKTMFQCEEPDNDVLVLFSPKSQEMDGYNYKAAFNALTNALIRLNIQFDVSTANKTDLSKYKIIFAPHLLDEYEARLISDAGAKAIYFVVDDTYPVPEAIKKDKEIIRMDGEQFMNYYSWIIEGEEYDINKTINEVKSITGLETIETPYNINAYVCDNIIKLVNYNGSPRYNFSVILPYDAKNAYLISPNHEKQELDIDGRKITIPYINYLDIIILEK